MMHVPEQEIRDTEEQIEAIGARGQVIVSASAGSGKTYVMIRRLTEMILAGVDVRSVLAVTFTNKAAAQMKKKLRDSLIEAASVASGQQRAYLRQQLAALPVADISTIHSFCARLLRTHFYLVGLDPAFRIVSDSDAEGRALWERAMNEVFEHAYREDTEQFRRLLSALYARKDAELRSAVARAYKSICYSEDPVARAQEHCSFEEAQALLTAYYRGSEGQWGEIARIYARTEQLRVSIGEVKGKDAVCDVIAERCEALLAADGLFAMAEVARAPLVRPSMPRRVRSLGTRCCADITELTQTYDRLAAVCAALAELATEQEERDRFAGAEELARAVNGLAAQLYCVYGRLKREAGVLDYDDLERFALQVLSDEGALAAVRERYRYVFVDEYQDVNAVQEHIVQLVGGSELFLVGDAKQAIYAFRGSNSSYFMRAEQQMEHALRLSENFRSAPAIIEAVNRVFCRCMTSEISDIDYADGEIMRGGRAFGEHRGSVQFHRLPGAAKTRRTYDEVYSVREELIREPDERSLAVVDLIQREVGKQWYDPKGREHIVGYGDIAVLAFSVKRTLPSSIVAALSQHNIPVTSMEETDIRSYFEVQLIVDWLSYLDNTEQDIPMAAAMLSLVGGFDEEELVRIRAAYPAAYAFRTACREYGMHGEDETACKLRGFFALTERLRAAAKVCSAADVIGQLLSLGLEAQFAARRDGEACLARVRRLIADAECDVAGFLQMVRRTELKAAAATGGDAVQVLTIHSVKGLEFPVVILVGLENAFRYRREKVCIDEALGTAPAYFDLQTRETRETLLRRAMRIRAEAENRKSNLNVFYVAMTRAQYRLHLLFGGKTETCPVRFANSMANFIDFEACADYFVDDAFAAGERQGDNAFVYRGDEGEIAALLAAYRAPYAREESVDLPVKCSASALLHGEDRPAYTVGEDASDREEGTAYHAFLQHVRFGLPAREELDRMRAEGVLTQEQLARLELPRLERMLALPAICALAGKQVVREQKFLVSLPAALIPALGSSAQDEVVVQGAIDALVREEDGYTILDYKFSGADAEQLKAVYAPQLALYRRAVAKITGTREERIRARIVNIRRLFEVEV